MNRMDFPALTLAMGLGGILPKSDLWDCLGQGHVSSIDLEWTSIPHMALGHFCQPLV